MANNSLVKELAVNNTVYDVGVKRIQNVDGLNTRLVNIDTAITTTNNNVSEIADTVDVLQSIGRFLSLWDATTGLMVNEPATDEFEYSTGDYFIVSKIPNPEEGTTIAFKPKGDTYYKMDPDRDSEVEAEEIQISDMYIYNGSAWGLLANHARAIAVDEELDDESKNPVENRVITAEITDIKDSILTKQDRLTSANAGNGIAITTEASKNLFDKNSPDIVYGHYINTDPDSETGYDEDPNYMATGFIKIDNTKYYTLSFTFTGSDMVYPAIYGYDVNKEYIDYYQEFPVDPEEYAIGDLVSYTFYIADEGLDNLQYIRFDLATESRDIQLEEGEDATEYEPYNPKAVISNTQNSAAWGNITGNLKDQKDLKKALDDAAASGGGAQQGVITWLGTRDENWQDPDGRYREYNWKGNHAEILFKISGGVSYLIDNMNEINICVNRFSRHKHDNRNPRNVRKYRMLRDHIMETTLMMKCWKLGDNEDDTMNSYFYIEEDFSSPDEIFDNQPNFYLYQGRWREKSDPWTWSNWASYLNQLYYANEEWSWDDIFDGRPMSRCPEHDVNTIWMTRALHGDNLQQSDRAFHRMRVREYEINGEKYFLGSTRWMQYNDPEQTGEVWVLADSETDEPIPRCVCRVKDMYDGKLKLYPKLLGLFGYLPEIWKKEYKRRKDLEFYYCNTDAYTAIEQIQNDPYTSLELEASYPGDFPIMPVRLSDCKYLNTRIRAIRHYDDPDDPSAYWEELIATPGQYLNFFEVARNHPEWLEEEPELIFKLPYSTYELFMRIEPTNKHDMWEFAKNNIKHQANEMNWGQHPKWGGNKGRIRAHPWHSRLTEKIQFFASTSEKIYAGERPDVNPISKTMTITSDWGESTGSSCAQTLI